MRTVEEYRRHAEEYEALARRAKTAEERDQITKMAHTWRLLADQREQMIRKREAQEAEAAAADESR